MNFDPHNVPADFPDDGILNYRGKPYVTHVGLVWLANQRGKPWSSTIDHPSPIINFDDHGLPVSCVIISTVSDGDCSHTDIGDATVVNCGKNISPHLIRMASTRAKNRALRALVGYAGCTADEIDMTESGPKSNPHPPWVNDSPSDYHQKQKANPIQEVTDMAPNVTAIVGGGLVCPSCQSPVKDQRASREGKQPAFKCTNHACKGGSKGYSWATWDEDYFADVAIGEGVDHMDVSQHVEFAPPQEINSGERLPSGLDEPPPHKDGDIPF